MPLPILDARVLDVGTEEERKAFGEVLLTRLAEDGAIKLANTTIADSDIIANAFSSVCGKKAWKLARMSHTDGMRSAKTSSICRQSSKPESPTTQRRRSNAAGA